MLFFRNLIQQNIKLKSLKYDKYLTYLLISSVGRTIFIFMKERLNKVNEEKLIKF